ncbi:ATP-binding protein [Pyxidicoccus parkwayensis]|uniref:ATP-binding protein n=1 Tax=Pyxidicoccus parkwayensis TaxID=2813578 RepID=A0ABX7NQI7_9BACT|nr:ATP-binding protein [Pyxidicoccus parkwaysis]QSQ21119.1 ATP-binding protein [Pyxidicoccus parkwaysis]
MSRIENVGRPVERDGSREAPDFMLTALTVYNFKSYFRAELPLAELTVLIGANASGKSNLIEALQFLSWLARGRRLSEILYALKERQLDVRGPISRLAFGGEDRFNLGCRILTEPESHRGVAMEVAIGLREDGLHVIDERAFAFEARSEASPFEEGDWLYDGELESRRSVYSGDVTVAYNTRQGSGAKGIVCSDQQAFFTQMTTPARFGSEDGAHHIPQAAKALQSTLESILFLDSVPRRMREYSFTVDRVLQGDGYNLSAVLYDLCERQQRKAQVLDFVRALPEQDILDVTFLKTPREEVMVQLTEGFGGKARTYEAALLSDGTLRVLSVAAALLSVPEGALIVIEEIDNGVHPTRAKLLLDNIQRVARERKLRVLLTTHNPALLDAIPTDAIPDVVACYRDPKEGDSRLMPLRDLPDYPELVAQGPVGQLVTRGILERYLKHPKTPEEKAAQAQKVLEMLESASREP